MKAKFDYYKYLERPSLLMNAGDETLSLFVGDRGVVKRTVADAINLVQLDVNSGEPTIQSPEAQRFLEWFLSNLTSKELLFESFGEIGDQVIAHHFLNIAISFPPISPALIVNLFSSLDNITNSIEDIDVFNYDYAYRWFEYGILRRANFLLDGAPNRKFELNELIPIAMSTVGRPLSVAYGISRSIAGSAFDAGKLSKGSVDILLDVFPGDSYFEFKLRSPL